MVILIHSEHVFLVIHWHSRSEFT